MLVSPKPISRDLETIQSKLPAGSPVPLFLACIALVLFLTYAAVVPASRLDVRLCCSVQSPQDRRRQLRAESIAMMRPFMGQCAGALIIIDGLSSAG